MKAWLIDVVAREIRGATWEDYKDIRRHIGGGLAVAVRLPSDDVVYVDDEGLVKGPPPGFFMIEGNPQPLAGNGLATGKDWFDPETGKEGTEDVAISAADLAKLVEFKTPVQVRAWAAANASNPAMAVTIIGSDGSTESEVLSTMGELFNAGPRSRGKP